MANLNPEHFTESERIVAQQFGGLTEMYHWARNFQTSFDLCRYLATVEQNELRLNRPITYPSKEWLQAAARDCVMCIYHFGRTIEGIDATLSLLKKSWNKIDLQKKKKAASKFRSQFPWWIELRMALAHAAERVNTPNARKKHGIKSKGPGTFSAGPGISITLPEGLGFQVMESLVGSTFSTMWEGKLISCEICQETADQLMETYNEYLVSFSAVLL